MAMDFWELQRKMKRQTTLYVAAFTVMTLVVAFISEVVLRSTVPDYRDYPAPLIGIVFLAITVGTSVFNYAMIGNYGGGYVARSMGANLVELETADIRKRQLLNIVEEISIASSLPMPQVYVIEAKGINAFAAGISPENAAITVTRGALEYLDRNELQGVIAHEFGHVQNGDMKLNIRLATLVTGFFVVLYMGLRILQFTPTSSSSKDDKKSSVNPILIAALILMAAGALSWLAGSVLRCVVSRKRESLADASAVQYTRHPDGLIGALEKIEQQQVEDMPKTGGAYAHLYFSHQSPWDALFATHPPIKERIAALKGLPVE